MLVPSLLPPDVWAEIALELLDARDLPSIPDFAPVPAGASFVARRVLDDSELAWFTARGIPVALLAEERTDERDWLGNSRHSYWLNGKLHRDGGLPAVEFPCGDREWYLHGKLHREDDLPALEWASGDKWWYVHGKLHRDHDRPAVEEPRKGIRKWYRHGKLHRDGDKPAIENTLRNLQYWYIRGKRHRDGGLPAYVNTNDPHGVIRVWYYHGEIEWMESTHPWPVAGHHQWWEPWVRPLEGAVALRFIWIKGRFRRMADWWWGVREEEGMEE